MGVSGFVRASVCDRACMRPHVRVTNLMSPALTDSISAVYHRHAAQILLLQQSFTRLSERIFMLKSVSGQLLLDLLLRCQR